MSIFWFLDLVDPESFADGYGTNASCNLEFLVKMIADGCCEHFGMKCHDIDDLRYAEFIDVSVDGLGAKNCDVGPIL